MCRINSIHARIIEAMIYDKYKLINIFSLIYVNLPQTRIELTS
jgi:hypothetical protein